MKEEKIRELISRAEEAKKYAYAPYSGFSVGAALLTAEDEIYTGCNIENGAFTPTNCAERTAIFKAVSEGRQQFCGIAIAADAPFTPPCGVCLQVMAEFCDPKQFEVILTGPEDRFTVHKLEMLLPAGFSLEAKERKNL